MMRSNCFADFFDGLNLQLPLPGQMSLRLLTPTLLEVTRINTKAVDPARLDGWDFFGADGSLHLPAATEFAALVEGQTIAVQEVGFKRRPLYAPLVTRDLHIGNRFQRM